MADWYVSSVDYAALPTWAPSTAYTVGQIIRPVTPTNNALSVHRCTTAGTTSGTEPASWNNANNGTTTNGTATFTNIAGQSAFGWAGAAGNTYQVLGAAFSGKSANGDRIFLGSDHSESYSAFGLPGGFGNTGAFGTNVRILSVNRAGSVPPVAADLTPGAVITGASSNPLTLDANCPLYWQGITFQQTSTAEIRINGTPNKSHYFKDCAFKFTNASNTAKITTAIMARMVWDNTTVQFANVAQMIGGSYTGTQFDLTWINTPSAIQGATIPTVLFSAGLAAWTQLATLRGVDLSALTTTIVQPPATGGMYKVLLDSCRIASGVTRLGFPAGVSFSDLDEVELVNCYDGTNVINERYTTAGTVTTDRTTYLSGGAQDDVGNYSLKLVTGTRSDKFVSTLNCWTFDVENTLTGSSRTATVEIISSGSLNNDDIQFLLEYMGTSGNPIASFIGSLATVLTTSSALSASSATWNSPPATPQKQLLQVTFTPQRNGRVRGLVRLGKASSTVWVNPQLAIA